MGIVVTIIMFLGLIVQTGLTRSRFKNPAALTFVSGTLLVGGLWNSAWYGLQNMDHFWGQIALLSGGAMILTGIRLFIHLKADSSGGLRLSSSSPILAWILWGILLICFLVYAVALIRLNLGLAIIR